VSSTCTYIHLSCRQYNCTLHLSPYHWFFPQGTLRSKSIIQWHMSLDYIGLANHLTLPYSLIHKNLLLSLQTSNGLGSWLSRWCSICHKQRFFKGELFAPFENSHKGSFSRSKWFGFLARCAGVTSHSAFPFLSTYPETSQNGSTSIRFSVQRYGPDMSRRDQRAPWPDHAERNGLPYQQLSAVKPEG